jgi:hypothetical protein
MSRDSRRSPGSPSKKLTSLRGRCSTYSRPTKEKLKINFALNFKRYLTVNEELVATLENDLQIEDSKYTSKNIAQLAKTNGVQRSMRRTGECWDSTWAEFLRDFEARVRRNLALVDSGQAAPSPVRTH